MVKTLEGTPTTELKTDEEEELVSIRTQFDSLMGEEAALKIRGEFEILRNLYEERLVETSYEDCMGAHMEEHLVTRCSDQLGIEEQYRRYTTFNSNTQKETETIEVTIHAPDGRQIKIIVDKADKIRVRALDNVSGGRKKSHGITGDDANAWVEDFFNRTKNAALTHSARTPDEQHLANQDALKQTYEAYPHTKPARSGMDGNWRENTL